MRVNSDSRFNARGLWLRVMLPLAVIASTVLMACAGERIVEVTVQTEIIRTVEVEVPVEVEREVVREVQVEVPIEVEKEVIREIEVEKPIEVVKEVVRTVEVEKEVAVEVEVVKEVEVVREVEIVKEVEVEVEKEVEVVKEVEVEVVKEVEKEVQVEVVVTATPVLPPTATPVPAATDAPPSLQAAGELVWAIGDSQRNWSGFNAGNLCCASKALSVVETLFKPIGTNIAENLLAESFEFDPDLTYVDVKLRQGVTFHKNFGPLTAEDVAWSTNDTNPNLSSTLGSGQTSVTDGSGTWAGFLGSNPSEALDDQTVRIRWENFDPRWDTWFFGQDGLGAGIVSKRAFDEMGKDWNNDNIVGTGPFEFTNWIRGDRTEYTALSEHWRAVPEISKITRVSVPDESVRIVMLQNGEADIAEIGTSNIPTVERFGMVRNGSGTARMVTVMFAGNLWETNHPTTGDPLEIVTYTHDLPWLGNPHKPDDGNNPAGMDDMEQARLVRQALAVSIDRELINEAIIGGVGWPVEIPYFDINHPDWEGDRWGVGYDPAMAESLLDQAGFPRGSNGTRFKIAMFAWPVGHFFGDIGDAVAQFWEEVGVDVDVLHYEYTVFRPTLVGRSATQAWTDTGPLENFATTPWDFPRGIQMSAIARGGKSHGIEIPEATTNYKNVSAEPDRAARIDLNKGFADFLRHWMPGFGVVAVPSLIVYNPNAIGSWDMEPGLRQAINSPEKITLP